MDTLGARWRCGLVDLMATSAAHVSRTSLRLRENKYWTLSSRDWATYGTTGNDSDPFMKQETYSCTTDPLCHLGVRPHGR